MELEDQQYKVSQLEQQVEAQQRWFYGDPLRRPDVVVIRPDPDPSIIVNERRQVIDQRNNMMLTMNGLAQSDEVGFAITPIGGTVRMAGLFRSIGALDPRIFDVLRLGRSLYQPLGRAEYPLDRIAQLMVAIARTRNQPVPVIVDSRDEERELRRLRDLLELERRKLSELRLARRITPGSRSPTG